MLKDMLKDLINPIADRLGVYDLLLASRVYARRGWIMLMYHRVVPGPDSDPFQLGMCVQAGRFRDHLDFIRDHFTVISVADGMERLARGHRLPANALSITFDDSYADFSKQALPVLREYGFPATLYAVTGDIERPRDFWWDRIIDAFCRTPQEYLSLDFLGNPAGPSRLSLNGRSRRKHALVKTLDWLWVQHPGELEPLVEQVMAALAPLAVDHPALRAPRMDAAALARLDPLEVDVQAHSVTHPNLTLLRPGEVLREMRESRAALEQICGRPVSGFAYPAGYQRRVTQQLAFEAGFDYAAGTSRGINRTPCNLYNLQRIGMPDNSVADIKRCLGSVASRGPDPLSEPVHLP